jgi:soluble lytic murein transglycosylase-like protein
MFIWKEDSTISEERPTRTTASLNQNTEDKIKLSYVLKQNSQLSLKEANKLISNVKFMSFLHSVDPDLILAIISIESHFNCSATSSKHAKGCMQVVPKYHRNKMRVANVLYGTSNLYNVEVNLFVGTWIFSDYLNSSKTLTAALLKFNGSTTDKSKKYAVAVLREFERIKRANIKSQSTIST